jgi:hypothetical protein
VGTCARELNEDISKTVIIINRRVEFLMPPFFSFLIFHFILKVIEVQKCIASRALHMIAVNRRTELGHG